MLKPCSCHFRLRSSCNFWAYLLYGALVLHIAIELGMANMGFVEKLVEFMPSEALDLRDSDSAIAFFNILRAGNIKQPSC
ncbi:hypothetical protein CK203_107961 [Vitis vinifera]|uniref:Uncharacterized protein n=1 Tax=Vitis vinifera TaxID=29760 RepID=A0A438BR08_VITVI|nr:hypothetical protein CK203_107961 [Vitis vinifera]